jgi:hypothetical protein
MDIRIVENTITVEELKKLAKVFYVTMIKGVVDIKREVLAMGGEYHVDANKKLIEMGSEQNNIWGFNIHFDKSKEDWIEYHSLINIRPLSGNRKMNIEDKALRDKMREIINSKII